MWNRADMTAETVKKRNFFATYHNRGKAPAKSEVSLP